MKISVGTDKPIEITPDYSNLREVLMAIQGCYDRRDYYHLPQLLLEAHYWRGQMEKEITLDMGQKCWDFVTAHHVQKYGTIIYATEDGEYCLLEGCVPSDTIAIYKRAKGAI